MAPGDIVKSSYRAFLTKRFCRGLRKTTITEWPLCEAIAEISAGLVEAKLGGHLFKKRVAVSGHGKRSSARVLIGTNLGDRWFFLYGFQKTERDNITDCELAVLQRYAGVLLTLDTDELERQVEAGDLREIYHEAKSNTQ